MSTNETTADQQRTGAALRECQARFEEAQRAAQIGSWEWEAATDTSLWSKELYAILDLDPAEPTPNRATYHRLYTAESVAVMDPAVASALHDGTPYSIEMERVQADGARKWLHSRGERWFDAQGQLKGLRGTILDITERKQVEAELRALELRYRRLFESTRDGILILDAETGIVVDVNPFLVDLLGFSHEEFLDKKVWELGFLKDIIANQDNFAVLQSKEYIRYEDMALETSDGRRIEVEFTSNLFLVDGKKMIQCDIRDISVRKQAEAEIQALNINLERRVAERTAELEIANRELEAFTYSVSHDLRAPVRAMLGFTSILCEEHAAQLSDQARRYLQRVADNAAKMGHLVDDLLEFSRLNRQDMNTQTALPDKIARQVWDELAAEREGRAVEFTLGDLPTCPADPALLKQVFFNLLANALKFSRGRQPAQIEVSARQENGETIYFVRDNGVGFDMQYAGKLFGVFQRLHGATEFEGTGVGRAIVQHIVQRHGGRVWAEAEVGKGATFYFSLGKAGVVT